MRLVTTPEELVELMKEDLFNWRMDRTFSCITKDGARDLDKSEDLNINQLTPLIGVRWDSPWYLGNSGGPEYAKDADYLIIMKAHCGICVYYHECNGYGTMTFDPIDEYSFMPDGTMMDVMNMVLTDNARPYGLAAVQWLISREILD